MTDTSPKPRCFHLTPDRLILALLFVQCLLWLSERFGWLPWHKGYAVLIALAVLGVAFIGMLVWFVVALLFRWRFQFSIRSLLVVVVAVAVPCSWLAVEIKKAKQQREVVQEIVQLRGDLAYDWEPERVVDGITAVPEPPEPNWLRSYCGEDFFDDVIRFDRYSLEGEEKPEDEERILDCLSRLTKLRTLDLSNNSVKDADFAKLKGLTRLKSLTLNVCQISDASLKYLEGMQRLEYLALICSMPNQVTDAGLEYLQGLTRLTHLRVAGVRVTDAGLKSIEGLTQLQELNFWGSEITDAGLGHLKGLTELQYLYLYNTQVTAEGEKKLQQALPNCKIWISH